MLRRFFASFFTFLFVNAFVFLVFIFGLYATVFSQSFYKEDLSPFFREVFVSEMIKQIDYKSFSLEEQEFRSIIEDSLTNDDIFKSMEIVYEGFNNAEIKDGLANVSISFDWLKAKNQVFADNLSKVLFLKLELCKNGITAEDQESITCIPENFSKEDLSAKIKTELDIKFFSEFPSSYDLNFQVPANVTTSSLDSFKSTLSQLLMIFGFVVLILFALINFSIYKPIASVLKWQFSALSIASFASILLVYGFSSLGDLYSNAISGDVNAEQVRIFSGFISILGKSIRENTLVYLVPVFVVSILILISVHFRFKENSSIETKPI